MKRQHAEAAFVDLDVKAIDRFVAAKHLVDRGQVARSQAIDGGAHPLLGKSAHFEETTLQRLEFFLKVPYRLFH